MVPIFGDLWPKLISYCHRSWNFTFKNLFQTSFSIMFWSCPHSLVHVLSPVIYCCNSLILKYCFYSFQIHQVDLVDSNYKYWVADRYQRNGKLISGLNGVIEIFWILWSMAPSNENIHWTHQALPNPFYSELNILIVIPLEDVFL